MCVIFLNVGFILSCSIARVHCWQLIPDIPGMGLGYVRGVTCETQEFVCFL